MTEDAEPVPVGAASAPTATPSTTSSATPGPDEEAERAAGLMSWVITIGLAVAVTVLIKTFVLQAYSIPSPSMAPTLVEGDRVIVFQLNTNPTRGDVIVFDRPANDPKQDPSDPDVLIKRVIGLPGETVEARDGAVYVDGTRLTESYLESSDITQISQPIVVPLGELLVLGDNRTDSFDGRFFGPIDQELVVGRAVALIWPPSRISGL